MSMDLLEERLQKLAVETPDAGRVTVHVLSRVSAPRRRRWPRVAALGMANVALLLLVAYFVPAADAVLADTPIAGDLLRDAGLVGAANRVTSVGAVATSSGYRVELVGAYADSARTVLLLHTSPVIWLPPGEPGLTDQFGRSYHLQSASGNGIKGDLVLTFEPLAWPDASTGARIALTMVAVVPVTCPASPSGDQSQIICNFGQPIPGTWNLTATVGVDQGTYLALPAPAHLGPATYRFTGVRSTAATVAVDIDVIGLSPADLDRRIPDGGKGTALFNIELLGPTGDVVTDSYTTTDTNNGAHVSLLGFRFAPGDYHVHVTYLGSGEFDRVLHVP
jgi:hypothetical protein